MNVKNYLIFIILTLFNWQNFAISNKLLNFASSNKKTEGSQLWQQTEAKRSLSMTIHVKWKEYTFLTFTDMEVKE